MIEMIRKFFLPKKIIKIKGKNSFEQLSEAELGMMIDAFLDNDESKFDVFAIYEFRLMRYKDKRVEGIRNQVLAIEIKNRTVAQPDGLDTPSARDSLRALSYHLKNQG